VHEIRRQDEKLTTEHLPPHVVELLAMKMTEADPQADTQLSLSCPVCGIAGKPCSISFLISGARFRPGRFEY